MKQRAYSNSVPDGFIVDRVRDSHLEARLVERLEYREVVTDPFGEKFEAERVEYRQHAFEAHAEFPQLMLVNPGRGVTIVASRLVELNQFAGTISPLKVDVLEWLNRFQKALRVNALVNHVHATGLELDPGVVASVDVRADRDPRRSLARVANGRLYVVERIQVQVGENPTRKLWLSTDGTARVEVEVSEDWIAALREILIAIARSQ